jgi:hypothetical protein
LVKKIIIKKNNIEKKILKKYKIENNISKISKKKIPKI